MFVWYAFMSEPLSLIDEIYNVDPLILEGRNRLLFTVITYVTAGGAYVKYICIFKYPIFKKIVCNVSINQNLHCGRKKNQ